MPSTGCARAYKYKEIKGKNRQLGKPHQQDMDSWMQPRPSRAPATAIPRTKIELRNRYCPLEQETLVENNTDERPKANREMVPKPKMSPDTVLKAVRSNNEKQNQRTVLLKATVVGPNMLQVLSETPAEEKMEDSAA